MAAVQETVEKVKSVDVDAYKYGFVSEIESEKAPKGLNEDIVRFISAKKNEPALLFRAQEHAGTEESRRGRSRIAAHLREARHSAARAGNSRRRARASCRG